MAQIRAIIDRLLTQASSMIVPYGFVCEDVLPTIYHPQKSGKLAKYGTNHLRVETTVAGGRAAYRRVESITRSQSTFVLETEGLEDVVTPDDLGNVENPYDAELDVVTGLTNLLFIKKEYGLASSLTSTATITQNTTLVGANQFSDYLNSDPISVCATARSSVRSGCGFPPNIVIMDWAVYNMLRYHPAMLDALGYKYTKPGGLIEADLAIALAVDKVLVAKSVYESAKEGQTSSVAPIWGKHIVFAFSPNIAARYQTGLGYQIQWSANKGSPRRVTKYPIYNPPGTTGITCDDTYNMFLSNVLCAYLIYAAIA